MNTLARCCAGSLIALGVGLGFVACGTPFSSHDATGDAGGDTSTAGDTSTGGDTTTGGDTSTGADGHPGDGPGTVDVDAGGGEDVVVLDAVGSGPCQGAFATPTLVLAHTGQYLVDSITLSTDELDAFVALMPAGVVTEQRQIYAMHRATTSVPFTMDTSEPLALTEVGSTPGAFDVALSADELTLYFSHRQDTDANLLGVDIYEAQRADAGGTFSTSSVLGPGIDNPTTDQFHAHPAGPDLYFTVAPVVSGVQGQRDLYVAPLAGGARAALTGLNGATTQEANPVPSRDELQLFFSSDRANPGGINLVYYAHRTGAALGFSTPALVTLAVGDGGTSIAPQQLAADACRLYILVDQEDAYVAQRAAN
jgi:hypothetical protein